ncbi:MAG: Asp-tRNA(Asn)/Glu-tRNA(Gln) amidotransferase subunit GatC [Pseudomonadota bacterium]|nr:Asp-tRNA(Asn)/Glu-tRNA(Gln) amidotransferase subunit GatC [Pseudomonadota bacterium]
MSMDIATIRKIARLSALELTPDEEKKYADALSGIFHWFEQLNQVDVTGVAPMTSVVEHTLHKRPDEVDDGNCVRDIMANAPESLHDFFAVPKVVE